MSVIIAHPHCLLLALFVTHIQGTLTPLPVPAGFYSTPLSSSQLNRYSYVSCPPGYYCLNGNATACPAGTFGNTSGLSTPACSGPCSPVCVCVGSFVFKLCVHSCISPSLFSQGYYCPPNSTSSTQVECGSVSVYCPAGSPSPIIVPDGLFSSGGQGPSTQTSAVPCPSGAYCLGGVQVPCPAGRYGCSVQISDPLCNGTTAFGHLFVLFYSPHTLFRAFNR